MRYVLKVGTHGRFEDGVLVLYGRGDEIELTAEEAVALGDRVAALAHSTADEGVQEPAARVDTRPDSDVSEWSVLDELHYTKAVELLNGRDDIEGVSAALSYELAHKNRPSITMAARERIAQLEAGEEG